MKSAVYAGTKNLYSAMCTAAKSLAKHSSVDRIYFLSENDTFPCYLPDYVQNVNVSRQRYFTSSCPNVYRRWTYMTLMRCVLSKYFPDLDKILWLDVDTVVQRNIDELWELDMEDYYVAGVMEPKKSTAEAPYINAGVMMINLKKLREDGMDDKLIDALNNKTYKFADQDCINEVCRGKILTIPSTYNLNNWTEPCEDPKILHFAMVSNWQEKQILCLYRNKNWREIRRPI